MIHDCGPSFGLTDGAVRGCLVAMDNWIMDVEIFAQEVRSGVTLPVLFSAQVVCEIRLNGLA